MFPARIRTELKYATKVGLAIALSLRGRTGRLSGGDLTVILWTVIIAGLRTYGANVFADGAAPGWRNHRRSGRPSDDSSSSRPNFETGAVLHDRMLHRAGRWPATQRRASERINYAARQAGTIVRPGLRGTQPRARIFMRPLWRVLGDAAGESPSLHFVFPAC